MQLNLHLFIGSNVYEFFRWASVLQSFFFLVMKNKLELNLTFIWELINVSKQVVWNWYLVRLAYSWWSNYMKIWILLFLGCKKFHLFRTMFCFIRECSWWSLWLFKYGSLSSYLLGAQPTTFGIYGLEEHNNFSSSVHHAQENSL